MWGSNSETGVRNPGEESISGRRGQWTPWSDGNSRETRPTVFNNSARCEVTGGLIVSSPGETGGRGQPTGCQRKSMRTKYEERLEMRTKRETNKNEVVRRQERMDSREQAEEVALEERKMLEKQE